MDQPRHAVIALDIDSPDWAPLEHRLPLLIADDDERDVLRTTLMAWGAAEETETNHGLGPVVGFGPRLPEELLD